MADVRSRLAALRARRQQRAEAQADAARPKCADPALAAACAAVGFPRQTWDADFRERLAGHSGSDDELDEIVVLPPAPIKLDPIAARVAWRKEQVAEAKRKTREIIREQFSVPTQLKSDVPVVPKEDVNDEEELLLEEEVDDEDESEDEEEGAETDSSVDAEDCSKKKDLNTNAIIETSSALIQPTEAVQVVREILDCIISDVFSFATSNSAKSSENARMRSESHGLLHTPSQSSVDPRSFPKSSPTAISVESSARTEDSSRVTAQLVTESSSTIKSVKKNLSHESNCSGAEDINEKRKKITTTSVSGRPAGLFSKLIERGSATASSFCEGTAKSRICAFIEDEAEDEAEDELNVDDGVQPAYDSDGDEEEQALIDDGIVADSQTPADVQGLAQFHREWEQNADSAAIHGVTKGVNVDSAMDLHELSKRLQNKVQGSRDNEHDDAASFCMGGADDKEETNEYLDAMFRDDNSRNEFKDVIEATPEDRKQQARALWKARQRHREESGAHHTQAISLFNAFGDAEDESDDVRSARIRSQLERACQRPKRSTAEVGSEAAIKKSSTDKRKRAEMTPEWERRRAAMQRVQKRRRAAVSMERWSYACDELDRSAAADLVQRHAARKKTPGARPVGGATYAPKPLAVAQVRCPPVDKRGAKSHSKKRTAGKRGTSLQMLFEALGERPSSDAVTALN